jgi:hypothetical protein
MLPLNTKYSQKFKEEHDMIKVKRGNENKGRKLN